MGWACTADLIRVRSGGKMGLLLEGVFQVLHDLSYCLLQVWLACCVAYQFKIYINQLLSFIPFIPKQLTPRQTLLQCLTDLP